MWRKRLKAQRSKNSGMDIPCVAKNLPDDYVP